jgi:hypothetical protein
MLQDALAVSGCWIVHRQRSPPELPYALFVELFQGQDMKTACVIFLAILLTIHFPHAEGAGSKRYGRMTGEEFINDFSGKRGVLSGNQHPADTAKRDLAIAYVTGVGDGSVDKEWCDPGIKPHEIVGLVRDQMRLLPVVQLRGEAYPLIIQALKKKLPCPPSRAHK